MKIAWRDTNRNFDSRISQEEIMNEFRQRNPRTSLDRLRTRYKRFVAVALVAAFPCSMVFLKSDLVSGEGRIWLAIAFAAYFILCASMDFWLYLGIGKIDPLTMSVSEVIGRAMFYRKRHLQFIAVLIPVAIALISFMAYQIGCDVYLISGMAIGGCIGLAIGSMQLIEFMRDYKSISRQE